MRSGRSVSGMSLIAVASAISLTIGSTIVPAAVAAPPPPAGTTTKTLRASGDPVHQSHAVRTPRGQSGREGAGRATRGDQAHATGKPVSIEAMTTETSRWWPNPTAASS